MKRVSPTRLAPLFDIVKHGCASQECLARLNCRGGALRNPIYPKLEGMSDI